MLPHLLLLLFNLNFVPFQANPSSNSLSPSLSVAKWNVSAIDSINRTNIKSCTADELVFSKRTHHSRLNIDGKRQHPISSNQSIRARIYSAYCSRNLCTFFLPRQSPHRPHIQLNNWSHNRETQNHISNITVVQVIIPQTNTTTRLDALLCCHTLHLDCQIRENYCSCLGDRTHWISMCMHSLGGSMPSNDKLFAAQNKKMYILCRASLQLECTSTSFTELLLIAWSCINIARKHTHTQTLSSSRRHFPDWAFDVDSTITHRLAKWRH